MLYVKLERCLETTKREVFLKDVATIYCEDRIKRSKASGIKLHQFAKGKKDTVVMSAMKVFEKIHQVLPGEEIQNVGETDFVLQYQPFPKKKDAWLRIKVAIVSCICFFGAGFTIMAFHNDIGITEVFQNLYFLLTGQESDGFTVLEVSYCIGLSLGILVFFNHIGKRRITTDPTPIEVEMNSYQEQVEKTWIETASREGEEINCN